MTKAYIARAGHIPGQTHRAVCDAELAGRVCRALGVQVAQHHLGALFDECLRDGVTEALGAFGSNGDSSFKQSDHVCASLRLKIRVRLIHTRGDDRGDQTHWSP